MGLNTVIPGSILLEIFILVSELSAFNFDSCPFTEHHRHSHILKTTTNLFIVVVAIYLAMSSLWIFYFHRHGYEYTKNIRKIRGLQGVLLIVVGALVLKATQEIKRGLQNECCALFEIHVVAGPTRKSPSLFTTAEASSVATSTRERTNNNCNNDELEAQGDLPPYEPPPSYCDLFIDLDIQENNMNQQRKTEQIPNQQPQ